MARMYGKGDEPVPNFRLENLLGRGGFGEVWRATGPGGTETAIKIIDVSDKQGLKEFRAVKLVKLVRHPHLVPIIAFWLKDENGEFFNDDVAGGATICVQGRASELLIAMGLGEMNLLDRLKQCQAQGQQGIPPDELLEYMANSARAIDFLNQPIHELGSGPVSIQHCDIKPQNILIVGGGVQVCDFGLARVLGDARITAAAGSAAYMAPEFITENKPSKTTDQYSLAISYIELRTGYLPFDAKSPAGVIYAHVQGNLDLSRLPLPEQMVIKKATAVDPNQRYPSTVEMVRALRRAVGTTASRSDIHLAAASEPLKAGMEIVPGYKLHGLLGKGAYGEVWESTAPGGKHVALKIIHNLEPGQASEAVKALEILRGADHEHLMELHAIWLQDQTGAIIPDTERNQPKGPEPSRVILATKLANKNLLQRLHECKQAGNYGIPIAELLDYLKQAASAIDYLNSPRHVLGKRKVAIQHRDIKPENILLAAGTLKVGDFALATVLEGASAPIRFGQEALAPAYAAPEVFSGYVTPGTDQYSLAVTYFHLRTGTLPFPSNCTADEMARLHAAGKLDLKPLPEAERAAIARATTVQPERRFANCATLVQQLERACGLVSKEGRPGVSRPLPLPPKAPKPPAAQPPSTGRSTRKVATADPRPGVSGKAGHPGQDALRETVGSEAMSPTTGNPPARPPSSASRPRPDGPGSSTKLPPPGGSGSNRKPPAAWKQPAPTQQPQASWLIWVVLLAAFAALGAIFGLLAIVIWFALLR